MAFYTIHPKDIDSILKEKRAILVDIRSNEKYKEFHMNRAINIPFEDSEKWLCTFRKGRCWMLYCEYGSTSLYVARKLGKMGHEVYTIIGGMNAIKAYFYN